MDTSDTFYQDLALKPTKIVVVLRSGSVLTFHVQLSEYLSLVRDLASTTKGGYKTYTTLDSKLFVLELSDVSCVMEQDRHGS